MGKLLRDDDLLCVRGCGIVASENIHLFTNPNAVVSSAPSSSSRGRGETNDGPKGGNDDGAGEIGGGPGGGQFFSNSSDGDGH